MRAAVQNDYGAAIAVEDMPMPSVTPDSVLIKVHASCVNPADNKLRLGDLRDMMPLQFPHTPGFDVSGEIVEVGAEVTSLKKGDEVYACCFPSLVGCFAEYVSLKASDVAVKPPSLSHPEAASLPLVALTAYQGLTEHGNLKSGQKVLIHAGTGGVGSVAIQIAKHLGAHVATTCSGRNEAKVRALGADTVIDYRTQKFEDVITDYDIVLDTIGGETRERSFSVLKEGGLVLSILGPRGDTPIPGKAGCRFIFYLIHGSSTDLDTLSGMVETGALHPVIDRAYPLSQVKEALDYSHTGRAQGKVVVNMV
ncbi:alcohol dehydrogenase superfamily, zinc-type protein [Kipferlia bialata]|uniref:Alcohol dehydrogenase superfamily, zinc-type protein n=1 Tax=Kipferlia bialata TaxID=797122 RepID=A0A9K3CSR7_9EUKA|nr:alcohol dehydrogenase superfamily, zinc-type protein [Kipferlia bialata]|eukprot:g2639.t1